MPSLSHARIHPFQNFQLATPPFCCLQETRTKPKTSKLSFPMILFSIATLKFVVYSVIVSSCGTGSLSPPPSPATRRPAQPRFSFGTDEATPSKPTDGEGDPLGRVSHMCFGESPRTLGRKDQLEIEPNAHLADPDQDPSREEESPGVRYGWVACHSTVMAEAEFYRIFFGLARLIFLPQLNGAHSRQVPTNKKRNNVAPRTSSFFI